MIVKRFINKMTTRRVLVEKAPFRVTLSGSIAVGWWYHNCKKIAFFTVKEGNYKDLNHMSVNGLHKRILLQEGFYFVIENIDTQCYILKSHATRI
jgi:hypothetical protein